MKRRELELGSMLYQLDTFSDEMYLIQSGRVEVTHFMKGTRDEEFLLERLERGSIVNHNSFLMNDGIDTNAYCRTTVTVYCLNVHSINRLRKKHEELDQALNKIEMVLVNPDAKEPALDYIIKDPLSNEHFLEHKKTGTMVHNYEKEAHRRKLTMKLKNAIMVVWLEVKESRSKPSMEEIIQGLIKKKREELHDEKAVLDAKKKERKEKRESKRL